MSNSTANIVGHVNSSKIRKEEIWAAPSKEPWNHQVEKSECGSLGTCCNSQEQKWEWLQSSCHDHDWPCNRMIWGSSTKTWCHHCSGSSETCRFPMVSKIYPRPREIGFDGGSEFKAEFLELCAKNMGIKTKPSGAWIRQSNLVLERVHQVLGDYLQSFNLVQKELSPNNPFKEFLTSAAYAIRSAHHTTLGYSPAQLVFGRDMFMLVNFQVDWERSRQINRTESKRTTIWRGKPKKEAPEVFCPQAPRDWPKKDKN